MEDFAEQSPLLLQIHTLIMKKALNSHPLVYRTPHPLHFCKKILIPTSMIFKNLNPIIMNEGFHTKMALMKQR